MGIVVSAANTGSGGYCWFEKKGKTVRIYFSILVLLVFFTNPIIAHEIVRRNIKSDQPIIINGRWIYPENGLHTVVMTDSNITVNDSEFLNKKELSFQMIEIRIPEKPPIKEPKYLDWLVKTAIDSAFTLLDEGRNRDELWEFMNNYFMQNTDGININISGKSKQYYAFEILHKSQSMPVGVSVPTRIIRQDSIVSVIDKIQRHFNELCTNLDRGLLIKKGRGSIVAIDRDSLDKSTNPNRK